MEEANILYHSDFDGVISASLIYAFLKDKYYPINLRSINYDDMTFFKNTSLQNLIIVDFLFNPNTIMWFDHHETSFKYFPLDDKKYRYWDKYSKSCASLIHKTLKTDFDFDLPHFKDIVNDADIIDSAGYKNVEEVMFPEKASFKISATMKNQSKNYSNFLVTEFSSKSSPEIYRDNNNIKQTFEEEMKKRKLAVKIFSQKSSYSGKDKICIFSVKTELPGYNRYFPFYVYKSCEYYLALQGKENGTFVIEISRNPWSEKENKVNFGELAKEFDGGGHFDVAGIAVKDFEQGKKIIEQLYFRIKKGNDL